MALPEDFEKECLYRPSSWFVHDLISVNEKAVVAHTDTTRLGELVSSQNDIPGHPLHVPGAVMVQITGTLGNLHAVYGLGLRVSEGWVGFGTHVRGARFPSIGKIGPGMEVALEAQRVRRIRGRWFVEYRFTYTQEGRVIYESEQSAIWAPGSLIGSMG
jgi:hypothetical protein